MSDKKQIVIKDACILIDLVDLNLLEDFFQLGFIALTTPQVVGEITYETQWQEISKFIDNGSLLIDANGEFEAIQKLFDEYPGLSLPDSSVLELAIRSDGIIYSSDGSLRKISVKHELTVRGILWIVEELKINGFLNKEQAVQKLDLYEKINERAPIKDIKNLINRLTKS